MRTRLMAMGNLVHRRPVAHVKDDIGTVWKSKVTTNDRDRRRFLLLRTALRFGNG